MAVEYTSAVEVLNIAEKLIQEHHQHLQGELIEYIFRDKAASKGGKIVFGKARKIRGLTAYLSRPEEDEYFLMEIGLDAWKTLTQEQKVALVDHELCHFGIDDNGNKVIIPHDLEEFVAVVDRHGLWSRSVQNMASALKN